MPGSADAGNGIGGTADKVKVLASCAIATSSITSSHIVDGAILNVDINASAAIALSKLASCPLARSGHTGTQTASTISDFDTEVANNTAVTANTAKISYCSTASTKLGTIETSATADQSNAEIVAAVEAGTDSNTFTDADHSKLDAIEASATADQTAGEIKTAYESNACTNALTDALSAEITANTAKTGISSGQASAITANTAKISYCSTASTKLGTIEGSATADQTAGEIKTAYESNACTNALTDALSAEITANTAKISYCSTASTKLGTIEGSATADQTNTEIRTAVGAATDSNIFTDANVTTLGNRAPLACPTFTGDVTTASAKFVNAGIAGLGAVSIQNQADDAISHVIVRPTGTGNRAQITTANSSDPTTDAELLTIGSDIVGTNENAIRTYSSGTGTTRPLAIYFDATKVMEIADANGVSVTATKKLYLDGGGDTYIYEPSADLSAVVAGNSTKMAWGALGTSIPATQRFYLDGSAPTGDTYFHESSADNIQFVAGGTAIADIDINGIDVNGTDVDNIQNLVHDISTTTATLNFANDQLQTISRSSCTTFGTASLAIGRSKTVKLLNTSGSTLTLTFPAWIFIGAKPADIAGNKTAILTITSFGTTDADCVAAYAVEE